MSDVLKAIASHFELLLDSWTSLDCEVKSHVTNWKLDNADRNHEMHATLHYTTIKPDKLLRSYYATLHDHSVMRDDFYLNGAKFATVSYKPTNPEIVKTIFVGDTQKHRFELEGSQLELPPPLTFFYINRLPLHTAIANSEFVGPVELENVKFNKFKFMDRKYKNQTLFYNFDATNNNLCVIDSFINETKVWTWKVNKFARYKQYVYPQVSQQTKFGKNGTEDLQIIYTIKTFSPDSVSAGFSSFWPNMKSDVAVYDVDLKRFLVKPKPDKVDTNLGLDTSSFAPGTVAVKPFVRANKEYSAADWLGTSLVGLGVCLIGVGLGLWLKSKYTLRRR